MTLFWCSLIIYSAPGRWLRQMMSMFFLRNLELSYWSDPKFWNLTILMILGWPPWPQGHRMVKIFQIGPQGPKLWIFEKAWFFEKLCCCFVRVSFAIPMKYHLRISNSISYIFSPFCFFSFEMFILQTKTFHHLKFLLLESEGLLLEKHILH